MSSQKRQEVIHPSDDPVIRRLMNGMDKSVADSFTTEQLMGLKHSISTRGWRVHSIDFRPNLELPFMPWSFYMVFLLGKNRRKLSKKEHVVAGLMLILVLFVLGLTVLGIVVVILYLVKSALGINIMEGHSLGIWDEVKRVFSDL